MFRAFIEVTTSIFHLKKPFVCERKQTVTLISGVKSKWDEGLKTDSVSHLQSRLFFRAWTCVFIYQDRDTVHCMKSLFLQVIKIKIIIIKLEV